MNTEELIKNDVVIKKLAGREEIGWINKKEIPYNEYEKNLPLSDDDLKDAEERLKRFAPFIKKIFS